ncbi:MAG: GNVR domain-containing protein [Gemmatimonadales bacterium]
MTLPQEPTPTGWYATGLEILRALRDRWRMVLAYTLAAGVVATATALLLPRYYTSEGSFQAEASTPSALSGALSGLASQLGALQFGTPLNTQFFADLLSTHAVLDRVAGASYPWRGEVVSLAQVYGYDNADSARRAYKTLKRLRKRISTDLNIRSGVIHFAVEARTPELALALADTIIAAMNEANIALRQSRASAELAFSRQRAEAARQELTAAEDALTTFQNRNRDISNAPALQAEEARLRRAVDMAQTVYTQLRLQQEQAAIQAVRNTPAISVVDPPTAPVRPTSPKRRLIVLLGLAAGFGLALLRLLVEAQSARSRPATP